MDFDNKEYARQMRENAVVDHYDRIICSPELWEQIASIIENIPTANVAEVKHSGWELCDDGSGICKNCNTHQKAVRRKAGKEI